MVRCLVYAQSVNTLEPVLVESGIFASGFFLYLAAEGHISTEEDPEAAGIATLRGYLHQ